MKYQLVQEDLKIDGYEKVVRCKCEQTQLDSIIAIHSTHRGPSLGGIRMLHYNSFDEGLEDVLRLSRGMTYKAFISGIHTGGGKSVIFLPKGNFDRVALFESFGQAVESLHGQYICAEDMGTTPDDMQIVATQTSYVVGKKNISGDPSYYTAHGLFLCLKAAAKELHENFGKSLRGLKVAIQGLGMVGFKLAEKLFWEGAILTVADVNQNVLNIAKSRFGAKVVEGEALLAESCDILSPCARGGIFNSDTIRHLQCQAIVGAANNQLETSDIADDLWVKGILYVPDYLANSGGLINVAAELEGAYDPRKVLLSLDHIPEVFENAYKTAKENNISVERVLNARFQSEF